MWKNRDVPGILFLDIQTELRVPPDIFGDAKRLPFRSGVFSTVFFDPPHEHRGPSSRSRYANPKGTYYGQDITKPQLIRLLDMAPVEFYRVLGPEGRLCFKWSEEKITLYVVLTFFKMFKEVYRKALNLTARRRRGSGSRAHTRGGGYGSFWVTFIKREHTGQV